ncbi:MAG: GNAT family N-acetyltransferase [Phycisphaerales bacterium]|nr:MAG: GNAT family N-acetyltransferase [Phycisphaerales bacterium]
MTIRPIDNDEIQTVVSVLRRAFATVAERFGLTPENCPKNLAFCTEDRIKDDLERGLRYYFLEDGAEVCGCVALEQARADMCYLGRLAVLPEHRSRGFGTALVRHALEQARAIGVTRVEIGIISEDTRLKDWYGRFGFVQTGTKTFDHLPFLVAFMAKEL